MRCQNYVFDRKTIQKTVNPLVTVFFKDFFLDTGARL